MPGTFGPPFRAPCDGWTAALKYYYSCVKHWVLAHRSLSIFPNTTLVQNPPWSDCRAADPSPGTPLTIYPIPRPACPNPPEPGDTDGCHGFMPCGPWPRPQTANTYGAALTTPKLDLAVCRKLGFKSLYSVKAFHGRHGFRHELNSPEYQSITSSSGDLLDCYKPPNVKNTVDDTKYRTLYYLKTYTDVYVGTGAPAGESASVETTDTVGRYTGHHSGSRSESGTMPSFVLSYGTGTLNPDEPSQFSQSMPVALFAYDVGPRIGNPGTTVSSTGAVVTYEEDIGGGVTFSGELNLAYGTFALSSDTGTPATTSIEAQCSNTSFHYKRVIVDDVNGDGTLIRTRTYEITCTLSDAYTGTQVQADADTAAATWNLCDDALYPWRTDRGLTTGPLVSYNEHAPTAPDVWPEDVGDDPWTDTRDYPRDTNIIAAGEIVGAPLPVGSQPYFNFDHIHWDFVDTGSAIDQLAVPAFYGQSNNRSESPSNISAFYHATQWTDNQMEKHLPPGPFKSYGGVGGQTPAGIIKSDEFTSDGAPLMFNPGVFWQCHYLEAIIPRESHNFFRPCGKDTLERDPSTVDCESNPTGDIRWPDAFPICGRIAITSVTQNGSDVDVVLASAADYLTTGDKVDFTGITGLGSNLTATVTDPTHISVPGTLDPDHPYSTGGFVKSHGAPAWGWNDNQTKIDFILKSWNYNFRDFMESYYVKLNALAPTAGCSGPTDPDPVRYIQISPTDSSNKDIIGTGSYWLESLTETPLCVSRNPCSPGVCIISGNAQSGCTNSVRVAPPTLTLDSKYGSFWLGRVEQWMTDPLWKAPGADYIDKLCDEECNLFEEDSVQQKDEEARHMGKEDYINDSAETVCIYPHRRYVEYLKALPTRDKSAEEGGGTETAPALPADALTLGCSSYVADLNTDPPTTAPSRTSLCIPQYDFFMIFTPTISPGVGGYYELFGLPFLNDMPMPWIIQLAQENTINTDGRFSADYQANIIMP